MYLRSCEGCSRGSIVRVTLARVTLVQVIVDTCTRSSSITELVVVVAVNAVEQVLLRCPNFGPDESMEGPNKGMGLTIAHDI